MRTRKSGAGGFDSSFDELLPLLALQPHQLSAVRKPSEPIGKIVGKSVGKKRVPKREIGRLVNGRLCGPHLH